MLFEIWILWVNRCNKNEYVRTPFTNFSNPARAQITQYIAWISIGHGTPATGGKRIDYANYCVFWTSGIRCGKNCCSRRHHHKAIDCILSGILIVCCVATGASWKHIKTLYAACNTASLIYHSILIFYSFYSLPLHILRGDSLFSLFCFVLWRCGEFVVHHLHHRASRHVADGYKYVFTSLHLSSSSSLAHTHKVPGKSTEHKLEHEHWSVKWTEECKRRHFIDTSRDHIERKPCGHSLHVWDMSNNGIFA